MTTLKAECRKFAPNIFNKTKCQNCFRTKDAHSAEALECNRATRKVSKCGYLFVAPDWDFSVSINRTKRWQRRWFVLYDDGELTYSVDEHPDTVPQAVIDMNKVLEVSDAEDVTGNQFAIAITAPEKVHFVKGTSREESKWWFDVLCRMPRNTIRGKHKRNATFPGGKATTTTSNNDHVNTSEESGASDLLAPVSRPRFLSTSESTRNRKDWSWLPIDPNDEEDVFPTKENGNYIIENVKASTPNDRNSRTVTEQDLNTRNAENMNNALNKLISVPLSNNNRTVSVLQNKQQDNKNTENNVVKDEEDGNEKNHDSGDNLEVKKGRSRRYLKRENRGLRSQRSRSDGVAKMIPGKETEWPQSESISGAKTYHQNPVYLLLSDNPVMKKFESIDTTKLSSSSPLSPRRRHTSEKESVMRCVSINEGKQESQLNEKGLKKSGSLVNIALDSGEHRNRPNGLQRNNSYKGTSIYRESQLANDSSNKHSPYITPMRPVRDTDAEPQGQGDTDTTGTDNLSIGPMEAGIDYCTEDMFVKKGWLMRQNISKEWYRHWFVLRNSSLTYYRDPSAEDCGILDGVLDLNQVTSIEEFDSDRNYAFCLMMWDNKKYVLSAVTAGIRNNWIQAIKHASDLWDSESRKDFSKNEIILPEHTFHSTDTKDIEKSSSIPSSPVPSRGEPEKMLDLSSSDDQSEYFSIIDEEEGVDRSSSPRALPPSPPLNRTPMSLVKERARFRSNSHCQTVRQCSLSSTTDNNEIRSEHHSDGTNSDHSSTCAQDSPQWKRKKYRELCCKLAEDNSQAASKKETNQYFKEKEEFLNCISNDPLMKESKDEINGTFQMKILEERCKELEVQLELKAKEVNEKTLELDSFKNLKTIYQGLVDKYNSLKKKFLDQSKTALDNVMEENYRLKYELLKNKYIRDRAEWENKFKKLNGNSGNTKEGKENNLEEFLKTLQKSKETLNELKNKFNTTEEQTDDKLMMCKEIIRLCEEVEKVSPGFEKRLKRDGEIKKLRKTVTELQSLCTSKQQQLEEQQDKLKTLNLIIEEKEQKIREFQNELISVKDNISCPQNRIRQQDEIFTNASGELGIEQTVTKGDIPLCNECLKFKTKFEMAREQIRRLKKEIKESHAIYDDLEINCFKLKQDMKTTEERYQSQLSLMTARVDDLTAKFTVSERNFRQLKQKMVKVEAKQERRRSSLKNKEALTLSKECEAKLSELEQKISSIETTLKDDKSWRRDDLPLSSYSQLESDDVNGCSERQSHKRSSQDSTSGSENLSLLLRLHTLGTRVKSATDIVEKQNQEPSKDKDNLERPKICLQVRNDEESSVQDEGAEDWSTLSFTTSMTDLQAIDGLDGEFPCTISECLDCLGQKIDGLISWVRTALQLLQKQEHGTLLGPVKGSFSLNEDAVSVASDLIETLDNLLETKMEDILESTQNGDAVSVTMLCYKILLLNETARILQKLNSSETRLVLEKSSVAECAFRVIERHLQQVIDLESCSGRSCSVDISGCTNTLKKLIAVCSTPFHTLLDPSLEDFSQTTHHPPRRLLLIEEECTQIMNMLDEARKNLFSILWQTLTDMPVQDDDQLHSNSSLGEDFEDSGLLLSNITIVVNEIFQIAEKELGSLQCQNLSLLWCEYESWNVWYSQTSDLLKGEMQLLLKELKKQCPQVSEDNILSSSFNDATYQKIILIASELAQFTISRTIAFSILSYIKENKDSVHNDKSYKEWLSQLHENYHQKADLLSHGGLSLLAQTLRHFSDETVLKQILRIATKEIKMSEELETAKHFHRKKIESMQNEIDSLHTERERLLSQGCMKCQGTHEEITHLQKELERVLETQKSCEECSSYLTQLQSLNEQHQTEVFTLHEKYNEKIDDLQKHLQLVLEQKEKVHQKEVQKLEIELQSAQKRLNHLEIEYDEQIQSLRELCEQKMSQKQDPINEESVRRRYQTEIEQLRCLCEKGIVAMENSHRRVTLELERRHKQEITLLEAEKEKALAEETQATLTALEVMRKAHAEELQREIAKFKEEFIKRMQIDHQSEVFHKDHGTELDEIKHEILSLSEKYSVKCLECASFEERVTVLSHQLQEANHQLFDLLARNKQLRVHLAMDTALKREATEGMEEAQSVDDLKLLLKLRDSELTEHEEENAQLRQDLHLAQMHVSMLDVQCEQLGQSLKAERRLREDEVSSLRTKLDAIISASAAGEESSHTSERSYRTSKAANRRSLLYRSPSLNLPGHLLELKSRRMLSTSRAKELMRSPSCPGLENSAPSS